VGAVTLPRVATNEVGHHRGSLPPGQRTRSDFPRFGLPAFAGRWPRVPASPTLRIGGDVDQPFELAVSELASSLPRDEQVSDLHCVTTWSKLALRWGGVRLRDVYEQLVVPRARLHASCRYLVISGLDGYRISLSLEDALQPDVMLAERLDGRPLPLEHGAPLRLVAPQHYGYKSVKHVTAIELTPSAARGSGGWKEHPRGRVALEERGQRLPGWAHRWLWRAVLPLYLPWFRRRSSATRPA
jgi:DMSO/TMAO reductase YedYZ molybdopterin-dependent catalytic subunit